ncbi:minor capsid protein [Gracilibacillus saliphilus]|uniref:minor capsid protein n=1 Tax=Gracilibacillus saliphilus TaxID=543890 RepID=UPI0013D005A8|nr:minor capsid protein [Gracilibacillus saliphilus]
MSSYWRDRELKHIEQTLKNDQDIIKQIEAKYREAYDNIEEQIEGFYGRYAEMNNISMQEARKRVRKLDIERYERKAKRYVETRDFTKRANEEMRLYNVTMQINRLELLKQNIYLELLALTSAEERIMYQALTESVRAEFERQAGILGQSLSHPTATVEAIVNASFFNATWSDRLWDNQDALRTELDRLLSRGIIQGQNPRQLARELRQTMDASVDNSERLLRTEMTRIQTDVQKDSFEQSDYKTYGWVTEPTACKKCKAMDGKVFYVSKMKPGVNAPPIHPNDKCSIFAIQDRREFERDLEERGL